MTTTEPIRSVGYHCGDSLLRVRARACGILVGFAVLFLARTTSGQEFHDHAAIWSTEDGGGQLATDYDFENKRPPLFFSEVCVTPAECIYNTINPAFLTAGAAEDVPDDELYPLPDGTTVSIELVAIASGLSVNISGILDEPGESAALGMAPFHTHPTWQLVVPEGEVDDYDVSFKLKTDSPAFAASDVYTLTLTNEQPIIPTPTPMPTATPGGIDGCVGDCNGDDVVSVDELVRGIMIMLDDLPLSECPAMDARHDGHVTLDEFVMAVDASLGTCTAPTLANIQRSIFTPLCATPFCHSSAVKSGQLVLEDGVSRGQLVNIAPDNQSARMQGFLRVSPANPESSFLLVKLLNPRPILGSRMPLGAPALQPEQIDIIRRWIAAGALP